jgi:transcriptional regulator with XRE-family HTH domain
MIASKILEARSQKGFSQGELAKRSGVYKSTIQRYEKGAKPIRRNLEKLAKALGVTVEYFFNEDSHGKQRSLHVGSFSEKIKKVIEFSSSEQRAVEEIIDQILEKRKVIGDLNGIVAKLNR